MSDDELTPEQIRERAAWCRDQARKGSDQLHARAATTTKTKTLTDAESAAIARAEIDRRDR